MRARCATRAKNRFAKNLKPARVSSSSVLVASHRQRSLRQSIYDISGAKAAAKARRAQKWIDEQLEIRRIYARIRGKKTSLGLVHREGRVLRRERDVEGPREVLSRRK